MKFKALLVVLLLMSLFIVHAFGEVTEAEAKARKKKELNELAERFKAETGFTGDIKLDYDYDRMGIISGKFSGISYPNLADTLAIRQSCDAIVGNILPYVGFEGLTLTKKSISFNSLHTICGARYEQMVHGFPFEWSGGVRISYNLDTDDVTIVDGIIRKDIPPFRVKYTFPQAVEIARQHYINVLGYPDSISFEDPKSNAPGYPFSISVKKVRNNGTKYVYDKGQYRLCHILGVPDPNKMANGRGVYIDAQNGEVLKIEDGRIE